MLHIAKKFICLESSAGIVLFFAVILALILNNSPCHTFYQWLTHQVFSGNLGYYHFEISVNFLVNDVCMVVFFLLVGLEIKREICGGELDNMRKIALPAVAAVGGMVVPAVIYFAFTHADPVATRGWAIPTATDIAFALAIVSLLGKRIPSALKIYLLALAIFDDLGAILIIAIFYQTQLSFFALLGILFCMGLLLGCNRFGIRSLWIYLLLGIALWGFFLKSGMHPTLAGVLLALTIPTKNKPTKNDFPPPAHCLEVRLHPWVAYGILPLFGFINSGIALGNLSLELLLGKISLGIIAGLLLGKQIGVFAATWLAIRCGMAPMPKGVSWGSLYAVAVICGVGFTISLFISQLAFAAISEEYAAVAKFGVLIGSFLSGILGYILLRGTCQKA